MNILFTNCSSDLYGSSRILTIVLDAVAKNNNVILVLPENGPLVSMINELDIPVKIELMPSMPIVARRMNTIHGLLVTIKNYFKCRNLLRKIIKKESIEICYINTLAGFFLLRIFSKMKIKTILHVHEILENPKKVISIINRYSLKWADRVICVSQPVKDNICLYGENIKDLTKVVVIFNGIADLYLPLSGERNEKRIVITLIGRITEAKGIWYYLSAIACLSKELIDKCVFQIVGGPAPGKENLIDKLQVDIKEHIYSSNIIFTPFIKDIRMILNMSDIMVVPSLMADPFPTTILEALSAGKPVIATNGGGAIQSIENNVSGIIIDRNNLEEFSEALILLINNEARRNEMGAKARIRYLTMFRIENFQRAILEEFDNFK